MRKLRRRIQRYSQIIAGAYRKSRHAVAERSPRWLRRLLSPFLEYYDLYMVDHGVFRSLYANSHRVTPDLWRSSQPSPHQIRRFARLGVRTVINLRGKRDCGSYRLEAGACRRSGITLIDFPYARSRSAPSKADLARFKVLFDEIEYPALIHCKSGADRAGLVSGLYLLFREGCSVEEAMEQLHIRYGHIRQAQTGVLDHFFEQYRLYNYTTPTPFWQWIEGAYDAEGVRESFRSRSWADLVVNRLARRE